SSQLMGVAMKNLGILSQPAASRAALVSLDPPGTRALAASLRAERLPVSRCVGWGVTGFQRILSQRETVLLDTPAHFAPAQPHPPAALGPPGLPPGVRALRPRARGSGPAGGTVDVPAALAAGAVNVLDRGLPPEHLAARIHADLRWLGRHPRAERTDSEPAQG